MQTTLKATVLIALFMYGTLAFSQESAGEPKLAAEPEPAAESKSAAEPKPALAVPPCACQMFPIMSFQYGDLYYCEYHEVSCNDPPEAAYVIGFFDWPADDCPEECIPTFLASKRADTHAFPGLDHPVAADYIHEDKLPTGKSREFTRILTDPKLNYVRCKIGDDTIYAKVLVFAVQTGLAAADSVKDRMRVSYIAFQTTRLPNGATVADISCSPVFEEDDPCHAFRGVYQPVGAKPIPILVLTAR